jgi:hypothetical protein
MNKLQDKLAASVRKARAQSAAPLPDAKPATPTAADSPPPTASAAPAPASATPAAAGPVAPSFDFPDRVWPD